MSCAVIAKVLLLDDDTIRTSNSKSGLGAVFRVYGSVGGVG
jgi:hypothetical protein